MKAQTATGLNFVSTTSITRILKILAFTLATAVAAHVKLPLPGTPVPMTLQTLVVLIAGFRLGARDGALSQIAYIAFGMMGLPLFAQAAGLFGPTGGYLIGFIFAAGLAGALSPLAENFVTKWALGFLATMAIFTLGAIQLKVIAHLSLSQTVAMGIAPFILGDLLKVTLAAGLAQLARKF